MCLLKHASLFEVQIEMGETPLLCYAAKVKV